MLLRITDNENNTSYGSDDEKENNVSDKKNVNEGNYKVNIVQKCL